ncbi:MULTISPECIES: DUF3318 domain-containing protein [unclassified Paraburkholderia]|uniref:DUF3318 domain-containing protein n=1 Tax=unclassified Paraburkholderia TaxID=2615204 RepID=UPI000E26AC53|nr:MULTISPECIES: DUF3318 domain-containing protein [unclassified Paraburkholderia]REE20248.1 uncharacterized protein DUF3318 [Paraburkholderia sp. BL27I4N3]REG61129.1 uncharacterized protein DUF3318 [Paraburkholderia sp. BL6669N2]RKR43045.1 uncharacterized protein DUF3318 [Paraburkholderia sp. BL17N1]
MSQIHSDTAFRNKRHQAKDLSAPHLRALRKELLLVRADVERMELAQATIELRQAVTHFSWLKFILPGFGGMRVGKGSKASFLNAGSVGALLKQYPLISSIASIVLAKPLRTTVVAGAKPVLKWGSVGLAAWEAYRIWQQMKRDSAASSGGKVESADSRD